MRTCNNRLSGGKHPSLALSPAPCLLPRGREVKGIRARDVQPHKPGLKDWPHRLVAV